jgi:peroxiredoxin
VRPTGTGWPALAAALGVALAAPAPRAHSQSPAPRSPGATESRSLPALAPDFERTDLDGRPVRLRNYRGKLVLLSFWATWCEPCRIEAPRFSSWQQQYGRRGLQVLGISMDDDAAAVVAFVRERQLTYPIILGDAPLAELFGGVLGLPLALLVDPQGRVVARYRGEPDLERMEAEIRAALPTPPP